MRYGSVCSGIEAATVAWDPLGWQAEFYSEIEPFPSHVLHEHYSSGRPQFMPDPDEPGLRPKDRKARAAAIKAVSRLPERANGVPNHGDMTQFERWPDHAIDLLVGGTPCQDYSIAGLRAGMDGVRGSLTLTYTAIARRYRPRWLVWENVFGVLSSKGGRDFASFLGLLSGRRIEVPADGWKSAGIVEGYGGAYGLAWRVLDTQYVRVDGAPRALPQRRRRVFVVGHSGGDWRRAAAVLFEREGLSGNPAPCREPGKGVAPTIAARPTGGGGLGTDFDLDGGVVVDDAARCDTAGYAQRLDWETENFVAHTLLAKENDSHAADLDTYVAHSLRAEGFDASEDGTGRGVPIVPVAGAICRDSFTGGAGGRPEGAAAGHFVPVSVAIRGRDEGGTVEMGDDVAHALRASQGGGDKPHVLAPIVYSIMPQNSGKDYKARQVEVAQPIMAGGPVGGNQGGDYICDPIAFDTKASGRNGFGVGEISPTLRAMGHANSHTNAGGQVGVAYPLDLRNAGRNPDKRDAQNRQGVGVGEDGDPAPTLTKEFVPGVATQWAVRRLTPIECARLQGFPDTHCRIPWRGKPAEQCPDGPQYKAYGNSMSTNVMRWIGQRIELVDRIASEHMREAAE
ncbi:MAG: DNA cytosine methyltransferase [Mesorhizobium sp.]